MKPESVILLQGDKIVSQQLVSSLARLFNTVYVANSLEDAQTGVLKHRAQVVVVDMESVTLRELQHFLQELPFVRIVCNHRIADDELWMAALNAGAADCCLSSDTEAIVSAALGDRQQAAAA